MINIVLQKPIDAEKEVSSELGCVSYPEHLGVVQSGHQHQALGGEDLSWLDDSRLLIHLIHLAGLGLLQLNTEKKRYNYSHIGDKHSKL